MTNKELLEKYQIIIERQIEELTELFSIQVQLKSIVEESETQFVAKQSIIESYQDRINDVTRHLERLKDTYNMLSNLISNYAQYQYAIDSMIQIFDIMGGLNHV